VIVRIQGEGQYEVDEAGKGRLEEIDGRLFSAMEAGDAGSFQAALQEAVGYVEDAGRPLPAERLTASDLILPARDTSLEEAKRLFSDEGYLKPVEA